MRKRNEPLFEVARNRGILDEVLPIKMPVTVRNLRSALRRRLRRDSLHKVLSGLSPLEQEIIKKMALAHIPKTSAYFRKHHGLENSQTFSGVVERLIKALRKEEPKEIVHARRILERMDPHTVRAVRARIDLVERLIIDGRFLSHKPVTLAEIGRRQGVTRERVRQVKVGLLQKLARFEESGTWPRRRRGNFTRNLIALKKALEAIGPHRMRRLRREFSKVELAILDRRVAPQRPDTMPALAADLRTSVTQMRVAEHRMLKELRDLAR